MLHRAASLSGAFFIGALGSLVAFVIMLFLLFFFLSDGDVMWDRARRLIPLDEMRKERLFRQLSAVTRAIVFGTTMTALLQGLLLGVGFAIAGLPSPVVFGVLVALVSMLPVGGATFAWVPAMGWLFYDGQWGYGIFMLVWGLMLAGIDNVLRPMLISGRARISATGGLRRGAGRRPRLRRHRHHRRPGGVVAGHRTDRVRRRGDRGTAPRSSLRERLSAQPATVQSAP